MRLQPIALSSCFPGWNGSSRLFAMKRTKGNQVKAAKLLGVTRATLRKRIERYGITKELNFQ